MARSTSSESSMSIYRYAGKPRMLIVSCRCTSRMTRDFRSLSILPMSRCREASRKRCFGIRLDREKTTVIENSSSVGPEPGHSLVRTHHGTDAGQAPVYVWRLGCVLNQGCTLFVTIADG